jgi:hypothetical protein
MMTWADEDTPDGTEGEPPPSLAVLAVVAVVIVAAVAGAAYIAIYW